MTDHISESSKGKPTDWLAEISSRFDGFLGQFEPWVETQRVGQMREGRVFACCVKSSLAKIFDFGRGITSLEGTGDQIPAYFVSGSLRGICEEVIILSYLQEQPNSHRDQLLTKWVAFDLHSNLSSQGRFFKSYRPIQNVLAFNDEAKLAEMANELRSEWTKLGWNLRGNQTSPSTWAIAKEAGLRDLYDYFYRFACDLVHFNPGVLLRFGWGADPKKPKFSASNFNAYYQHFGLVYGAYFWCLVLQLLRRSHRMPKEFRPVETEMIDWLFRIERWPEMVTREELNIPTPKPRLLEFLMRSQYIKTPRRLITRKLPK